MKRYIIYLVISMNLLSSCDIPEAKELSKESKSEVEAIISELELEQFSYSFHAKSINGVKKRVFFVDLYDIDDSTSFENYNTRIISIFERTDFDLKSQDFVRIAYFKSFANADVYVYYDIDPVTKEIIDKGTE